MLANKISIYLGLTLMISSSGESLFIETFNILTDRPIEKVDMEQYYSLNSATLDTISGATAKG